MKTSEYCVFVFRRGNSFNGHKLNHDGSIIYSLKTRKMDGEDDFEYVSPIELTIEHKYGDESNSEPYNMLSSIFTEGDVLRISSKIDDNGVFTKTIEKVIDKEFCLNTKKSWDLIKHHWFRPDAASKRIEEHLLEL